MTRFEAALQDGLNFEQQLLLLLRDPANRAEPIGPDWLQYAMANLTSLGSSPVLILLTLLGAGALVVRKEPGRAALLSISVMAGMLLCDGLKLFFLRDRPDVVVHLTEVSSASFPSGHAMNSAIVYLNLAAASLGPRSPSSVRLYSIAAAIMMALLVGLSRVYLGVHWPSDVVAGWLAGALWVAICFFGWRCMPMTPAPRG